MNNELLTIDSEGQEDCDKHKNLISETVKLNHYCHCVSISSIFRTCRSGVEQPVVVVLTFDKETIIHISAAIQNLDVCLRTITDYIQDCDTNRHRDLLEQF